MHTAVHRRERHTATFRGKLLTMSNAIEDLLAAPPGETVIATLARYAQLLKTLGEPEATYRAIRWKGPDTAATVETFVQASGFPLPKDLVDFYLEHGGVAVGQGWGSVRLFGAAQSLAKLRETTHGLLDSIQHIWGGRPEFDEAFSGEQTEKLNRNYLVIGITDINDNAHRYLYVDRAGRCGALLIDQDYIEEEHLDELLKMVDTSPAHLDFNTAFVAEIQAVMAQLANKPRRRSATR